MGFVLAGLLLLARTPVDATYVRDLLPPMILIGLGAGLGFPSLMTLAMSGTTEGDSGLASGLVNTSVQVGGAIGLAVLATLVTERTGNLVASGEPAAAALNSGYHLAYLTGAGLVLVAIVVAVRFLRARVPEGAPEPEPVPEVPAEPVPGAATEPEAPSFGVQPFPAYAEAQIAGCQETGMRVVIGCGGCAGSAP
jgi:Major Facilitator Superfamily